MSDWKISVKEEMKFCRYFWTNFDFYFFFWLGLHGMEMIKQNTQIENFWWELDKLKYLPSMQNKF